MVPEGEAALGWILKSFGDVGDLRLFLCVAESLDTIFSRAVSDGDVVCHSSPESS